MAELAPDDVDTSGSHLQERMSITVTEQTADGAIAKIRPKKAKDWKLHEFGSAHEPARPFMRPGFDDKVGEATQIISDTLESGIIKAFGGIDSFE